MFNVLTTAMTVIPPEPLQYERFVGKVTNEIGIDVVTFAAPVKIEGTMATNAATLTTMGV